MRKSSFLIVLALERSNTCIGPKIHSASLLLTLLDGVQNVLSAGRLFAEDEIIPSWRLNCHYGYLSEPAAADEEH